MIDPTQVPCGWHAVKLMHATQPRAEKVSPADYPEKPFLGMDHVEAHTMKIIGSIPSAQMKSNAARFYENDVLYGRLRPYLNKVVMPNFDGLASAEFIVFPENKAVKSSFLKYRLNSSDFVSFSSHLNEGDRPRVSFDQIGEFDLLLPPINEQTRIVEKIEELFSELDKGVESLKTAQQQLKVYRQALLKQAFEGKLTEQWRKDNPDKVESAEQLLARIKAEREARYQQQLDEWKQAVNAWEATGKEGKKPTKPKQAKDLPALTADELAGLPALPKGWAWIKFGNLTDYVTSGSRGWKEYYSNSGATFIRAQNLKHDSLNLNDIAYVDLPETVEGKRSKVNTDDILITITGANVTKAGIVIEHLEEAYVSQHVALCRLVNTSRANFSKYSKTPALTTWQPA